MTQRIGTGHLQRGGAPSSWDGHPCTRCGVSAVAAVVDGAFGHMVALTANGIEPVPLLQAIAAFAQCQPTVNWYARRVRRASRLAHHNWIQPSAGQGPANLPCN